MAESTRGKVNVELGPLFTAGIALTVYGLFRRRKVAVLAGLVAIWLDQRSEVGRSLKEKVRAKYMTVQVVEGESSRASDSAGDTGVVSGGAAEGDPA